MLLWCAIFLHGALAAQSWNAEEQQKIRQDCMKEASSALIPGAANDYCDCYLSSFLQHYPDRSTAVQDSVLIRISDACMEMVKYRYPGGPFIERWTEDSRSAFVSSCKRKLSGTKVNADNYCNCMLEKVIAIQPDPRLVQSIEQLILDQFALECLGKTK